MTICQRKCKKSRNVTEIKKSIAREDSSASSRFYRLPQGDTSDKKKKLKNYGDLIKHLCSTSN